MLKWVHTLLFIFSAFKKEKKITLVHVYIILCVYIFCAVQILRIWTFVCKLICVNVDCPFYIFLRL